MSPSKFSKGAHAFSSINTTFPVLRVFDFFPLLGTFPQAAEAAVEEALRSLRFAFEAPGLPWSGLVAGLVPADKGFKLNLIDIDIEWERIRVLRSHIAVPEFREF